MATNMDKVKGLGYEVQLIQEAYEGETSGTQTGVDNEGKPIFTAGEVIQSPAVYRVTGYGVDTMVAENDTDAWKALANPEAHAYRELAETESDPLVLARADLDAQVSLGNMTKTDADKLYAEIENPAPSNFEAAIEAVVNAADFNEAKSNLQALLNA